jgi:hypothetical protein
LVVPRGARELERKGNRKLEVGLATTIVFYTAKVSLSVSFTLFLGMYIAKLTEHKNNLVSFLES